MKPKTARLILLLVYLSLSAVIITGIVLLLVSITLNHTEQTAFSRLEIINQYKKQQLTEFFTSMKTDAAFLAAKSGVINAAKKLTQLVNQPGTGKQGDLTPAGLKEISGYPAAAREVDLAVKEFCTVRGYPDLLLISPAGRILHTLAGKGEAGLDLAGGRYSKTSLAELWQAIRSSNLVMFTELGLYQPGDNEPAMFLGAPILVKETFTGILCLKVPLAQINYLTRQRTGLGNTGETWLVGEDKRLRADSFLNPARFNVRASLQGSVAANGMDTQAVQWAFTKPAAVLVFSEQDNQQVAAAWDVIPFVFFKWALVTTMELREITAPFRRLYILITIVASLVFLVAVMIFTIVLFAVMKSFGKQFDPEEFDFPEVAARVILDGKNITLPVSGKIVINNHELKFRELILKSE